MAKTPKGAAQITGDGAHIATLAAYHFQFRTIRILRDHVEPVDEKLPRGKIHFDAFTGKIVGAFAVDLHGRDLRRHLHDRAAKGVQRGFKSGGIMAAV